MNIPRIAIIGCGTVAQRYYAPALRAFPEIRKKALLVDSDRSSAEALRNLLGAGRVLQDHRESVVEADGALILVPHDLHYPVSMDFLSAGVHVLCEKPLAINPWEAEAMINAAEGAKAALCLNYTRRLFPSFQAVHGIIRAGELGRIRSVTYQEGSPFGWPSSTGFYVNPALSDRGILLDLGSHVVDTVCWWLGGKPALREFMDDSRGGPESVARFSAEWDGCIVEVFLNRLCQLDSFFEVEGDKGTVRGKINDWRHVTVIDEKGRARVLTFPCRERTYPAFVAPVLKNFIQVVQGEGQPLVPGRDALAPVELIHECYGNRRHFVCAWEKGLEPTPPASPISVGNEGRRILVTGATGFIGGRIMEVLGRSHPGGDVATACLRQWSSGARLGRAAVSVVMADLMDKGQIIRALGGITHVIHCAKGTPEATVEGTRNLLDACLERGVRHVIHMSTADVYGDVSGIVNERHPCRYTGNPYNRMKIKAEEICLHYQEKGLPITLFRPSIVYGPFSTAWSLRFAAMFEAGEWGIYDGYGEGLCNLIYIDDLVTAILDALGNREAFGKAFNINGPEIITWNEYFTILNMRMGLPPLKYIRKNQTDATLYLIGPVRSLGSLVKKYFLKPVKKAAETFDLLDAAMRRAEHAVKTTPSQDELELFSRSALYSDVLARKTLRRCPETGVETGMGHTIEWLRFMGVLGGDNDPGADGYRNSN